MANGGSNDLGGGLGAASGLGIASGILGAGNAVAGAIASSRAAKAYAKYLKKIKIEELKMLRLSILKKQGRRLASGSKTIGGAGIDVNRGSPVEALTEAAQIEHYKALMRLHDIDMGIAKQKQVSITAIYSGTLGATSAALGGATDAIDRLGQGVD